MLRFKASIVAALFAVGSVSNASATLVAHWTFDEGSGNTLNDASGNGNTLTYLGPAPTWNTDGAIGGSATMAGTGALARTGVVNDATISNFQAVTGNKVTVSFWAKPNSENIRSNPFYIGSSAGGQGNRILASHLEWSNGQIYWDVDWGDGTNQRINQPGGTVSDQLHHYVMNYNGDTGLIQMYKDNALLDTATVAPDASINWAGINNIELGAFSFDSFWNGELDDFAIWNETLSTADIDQINRNGVAVLPSLVTIVDEKFEDGNAESRGWVSENGTLEDWVGAGGAAARGLATTYDHDNNPGTPEIPIPGGVEVLDTVADNTVKKITIELSDLIDVDVDGVFSFFAANRIAGGFGGNDPQIEVFNVTDGRSLLLSAPSYANGNTNWTFNRFLIDFTDADRGDTIELRFSDLAIGAAGTARGLQVADVQFVVSVLPEPMTAGLSVLGMGVLAMRRRRR